MTSPISPKVTINTACINQLNAFTKFANERINTDNRAAAANIPRKPNFKP